jgi:type VI secretion system protein ImpH
MAHPGVTARSDAPYGPPPPPQPEDDATVDSSADEPTSRRTLAQTVAAEPTSFAAFQLVRMLERMYPERATVGQWTDPDHEVVRFTVPPTFAFPPAEVHGLTLPDTVPADEPGGVEQPDGPAHMAVTFFGLTGPQGVLPLAYTQHAADRVRARDTTFRDFLDLFHHRVLSFFYRAWIRPKAAPAHEAGRTEWLLEHLLDVAGLGTSKLRGRSAVRDEAIGYYAGLFASKSRPADGLACLVGDYFDVPVAVEEFVGEWRRVDDGGQCELGTDAMPSRLGDVLLGDAAWDPQARVRLRLGPLTRAQFDAFLPGGGAHAELRALAHLYADDDTGVDAQLVLARAAVTPCVLGSPLGMRLGGPPDAEAPARLGRGTWLASRPMTRDPDETTFALC